MTKELKAQSLALAGPGDQTGHVSHGIDHIASTDHTKVWHQRGERVIGDLGARSRKRGNQTGLTRTRVTHECYICHRLEFQDHIAAITRFTE